jgi:hypothetical protein
VNTTTSSWPHDARVLAFVMAGGEGSRLFPLTAERVVVVPRGYFARR